jgi:hypothetical protein
VNDGKGGRAEIKEVKKKKHKINHENIRQKEMHLLFIQEYSSEIYIGVKVVCLIVKEEYADRAEGELRRMFGTKEQRLIGLCTQL